jgi:hypothetical protein
MRGVRARRIAHAQLTRARAAPRSRRRALAKGRP